MELYMDAARFRLLPIRMKENMTAARCTGGENPVRRAYPQRLKIIMNRYRNRPKRVLFKKANSRSRNRKIMATCNPDTERICMVPVEMK